VFDPYRLAVEVGAAQSMATAARDYQTRAATTVKQIWRDIRSNYLRFGGFQERGDGSLDQSISPHSYVFAGIDKDGAVVAAGGNFTEHPGHAGILVFEEFEVRVKKDSDVFFWRSGIHNAIPDDAEVSRLINSVGGPEALKQLVELQIRTTPRLVGPPVSVLVVSASDNNSWHGAGACGWKP
jgi:hypothetical protein